MNNLALSGHSYGGGAAALYLARNDPRVKVGLLVAPYCLTINVSGFNYKELNFNLIESHAEKIVKSLIK